MLTLSIVFVSVISFNLAAPLDESTKITVNKRRRNTHELCQVPPTFSLDETDNELKLTIRIQVSTPTTTTIAPTTTTTTIDPASIIFAPDPSKKWPNGTVPYVLDSGYSKKIRQLILDTMSELEEEVSVLKHICVKFVPRTVETNYIKIQSLNGCYATIGMNGIGQHNVSLSPGCFRKITIKHELMHVLGFYHEYNRFDRDKYININWTNIADADKHIFQITRTPIMKFRYDIYSIMHYGAYDLAIDEAYPTMTTRPHYFDFKMGQQLMLSKYDALKIQRWYGCEEGPENIKRPDILTACDFLDNTLCDFKPDTSNKFKWKVTNGGNGIVPHAGATNGADPYMVALTTGQRTLYTLWSPFFPAGYICVDFYLFLSGPTSKLYVGANNVHFNRYITYDSYEKRWRNPRVTFTLITYDRDIKAEVIEGDVAIDDIVIYRGACL